MTSIFNTKGVNLSANRNSSTNANLVLDSLETIYQGVAYTSDGKHLISDLETNPKILFRGVDIIADAVTPIDKSAISKGVAVKIGESQDRINNSLGANEKMANAIPSTTISVDDMVNFLSCQNLPSLSAITDIVLTHKAGAPVHITNFWSNVLKRYSTFIVTVPHKALESLKKINALEQKPDVLEPTPHMKVLRKHIRSCLNATDQLNEELVTQLAYHHMEFSSAIHNLVVTDKYMEDIEHGRMPNSFPKATMYIEVLETMINNIVLSEYIKLKAEHQPSNTKDITSTADVKAHTLALGHMYKTVSYITYATIFKNNFVGWTNLRSDRAISNMMYVFGHFRDRALKRAFFTVGDVDQVNEDGIKTPAEFDNEFFKFFYDTKIHANEANCSENVRKILEQKTVTLSSNGALVTKQLREACVALRIRLIMMNILTNYRSIFVSYGAFNFYALLGFILTYIISTKVIEMAKDEFDVLVHAPVIAGIILACIVLYKFGQRIIVSIGQSVDGRSLNCISDLTNATRNLYNLLQIPTTSIDVSTTANSKNHVSSADMLALEEILINRAANSNGMSASTLGRVANIAPQTTVSKNGVSNLFVTDDLNWQTSYIKDETKALTNDSGDSLLMAYYTNVVSARTNVVYLGYVGMAVFTIAVAITIVIKLFSDVDSIPTATTGPVTIGTVKAINMRSPIAKPATKSG